VRTFIHSLALFDIQTDQILASRIFYSQIFYLRHNSYFSGFKNKDVAFFHSTSKTLITADLIFNLPATEQVIPFSDMPEPTYSTYPLLSILSPG
jgi:hypothetical protein